MMLFTLFDFEWKDRFWVNLVQKVKIISWSWNLVPALIQICKIQWCCLLFLFFSGNSGASPLNSTCSNSTCENLVFLDQICPKRVFPLKKKNKKNKKKTHHWILQIRIRLDAKFQLKVRVLDFWTKFAQKGHFHWKRKKVNSIIEFCVFELG